MVALDAGLHRTIKIPTSYRADLMDTMRIGKLKTTPMMGAIDRTEAEVKTGVEGGRLRNGRRGDQQRQVDTFVMTLEVEAPHLVEDATASRTRTTSRISIAGRKVINSIINQKECTTMAHRNIRMVDMGMMSIPLMSRIVGHQCSTTIVPLTATTSLIKTLNTMLAITSKIEETHTTGGSLHAVIEMIKLQGSRKRQHLGSIIASPTPPDLITLSSRDPVSWPTC